MAVALDLLAVWTNVTERENIWTNKNLYLHVLNYTTPSGVLKVQQGWYFSAHEQWKWFVLPYRDGNNSKAALQSTEKARTYHSTVGCRKGLYSQTNNLQVRTLSVFH